MASLDLIQGLIDKRKYKKYLEIGVLAGNQFFRIKCKKKIAVDPEFRFGTKEKLRAIKDNISNISNSYFEVTSDDFFKLHADSVFNNKKADLCFVDGMHEFRYVLNDVENCLKYLEDDGVIIMHDCNPESAAAECSFADWKARGFTGLWNGDTWKTVTYLIDNRPDLEVFTANCDFGLGIVTRAKQPRQNTRPRTYEQIDALSYEDLAAHRNEYLNLKPESYAMSYFQL